MGGGGGSVLMCKGSSPAALLENTVRTDESSIRRPRSKMGRAPSNCQYISRKMFVSFISSSCLRKRGRKKSDCGFLLICLPHHRREVCFGRVHTVTVCHKPIYAHATMGIRRSASERSTGITRIEKNAQIVVRMERG